MAPNNQVEAKLGRSGLAGCFGRAGPEGRRGRSSKVTLDLHLEIRAGDANVLRKGNTIAWGYKITIYDALYVALAEEVGYQLVTADEVTVKKLKGHSMVVPLELLSPYL